MSDDAVDVVHAYLEVVYSGLEDHRILVRILDFYDVVYL